MFLGLNLIIGLIRLGLAGLLYVPFAKRYGWGNEGRLTRHLSRPPFEDSRLRMRTLLKIVLVAASAATLTTLLLIIVLDGILGIQWSRTFQILSLRQGCISYPPLSSLSSICSRTMARLRKRAFSSFTARLKLDVQVGVERSHRIGAVAGYPKSPAFDDRPVELLRCCNRSSLA